MELHLVRVDKMAGVLPDMEAGVEACIPLRLPALLGSVLKKHEVQDADAHAFLKHVVAFPRPDLAREHLRQVEQRAVGPYRQLGELDFNVNLRAVPQQYPDVKDALLVVRMLLPEARVEDLCFPYVLRAELQHGGQEADTRLGVHHNLLEGEVNLGLH